MSKESCIKFVFCFDSNYINFAKIAIKSLLRKSEGDCFFYLLAAECRDEQLEEITSLIHAFDFQYKIFHVDYSNLSFCKEMAHLKMPTYLRLLIPSLIDEDRILYIDCDTYINEDLTSLFNINLEEKEIAVALDQHIKENEYFNAGVILWDLKNLDRKSFLDKCKKIYLEKEAELLFGDQCILNYLYADKKKIIPPNWNEQVLAHSVYYPVLEYFISNGRKIIHFAGPVKPWECEFGSAGWKFWQKYMV